jgi:hypothetical protein
MVRDDEPDHSEILHDKHTADFMAILGGTHSYTLHWSDKIPDNFWVIDIFISFIAIFTTINCHFTPLIVVLTPLIVIFTSLLAISTSLTAIFKTVRISKVLKLDSYTLHWSDKIPDNFWVWGKGVEK